MRFVVALVIVGAMAAVAPSQEARAPAKPATDAATSQPQKPESESKAEISVQETTSTFKLLVNLVQVHVVVRGDKGKTVDGLRKEDFQLYDNGKLQTISTFAIENEQSRKERTEAAVKTQVNDDENTAQAAGRVATVLRRPPRFLFLPSVDTSTTGSREDP